MTDYAWDVGDKNAAGRPFSSWKPAEKFAYVFAARYPKYWLKCQLEVTVVEGRRFAWDYAWTTIKLAVEIDGFGFGHQSQQGMSQDNEKANLGVLNGWRLLRFNSRDLGSKEKVDHAVRLVAAVIES